MARRSIHRKNDYDLEWPKLLRGELIRRYNRFMADVRLRNGHVVTAHCPNTGRMLACSQAGRPVYLSRHHRQERKLKYTWELIQMPTSLVGVNTNVPNRLVETAIASGRVPQLSGYDTIRREVPYGRNSRIDLLLQNGGLCYVEVKNCTLVEEGTALFPDAVTERGRKHLEDLQREVHRGNRAVMFYLIQRMDAERFRPADTIDKAYGKALRRSMARGVEALAYDVVMDTGGIRLNRQIPIDL